MSSLQRRYEILLPLQFSVECVPRGEWQAGGNIMKRSSIGAVMEAVNDDGKHDTGRFAVEILIANNEDLVRARDGDLDPAKVRRQTIRGIVDPGATLLVL